MPHSSVYSQICQILKDRLAGVRETTVDRVALLVMGVMKAGSASPARIANALAQLGLSKANSASIERRIRRIENDPDITASLCFHPFARQRLLWGRPERLQLILDPTTQDDRVVMLCASIWYRGRALPLVWQTWPGNRPLSGARFWERVSTLLDSIDRLLPVGVEVIWTADRAFGTPAFTDLLMERNWHYVVRVQGHTLCRDVLGREKQISSLVSARGQRAKMRGLVFKKRGWREASAIVLWGRRHKKPLCLVADLPPRWRLIRAYRHRYAIEASFRDVKSYGWHWEQGQVVDLSHVDRLLVGMALASWLVLSVGTRVAAETLAKPPTGRRRTRPPDGKYSLFSLGLQQIHAALLGGGAADLHASFTDWTAPNWSLQITWHHARAFVLGVPR